MHISNKRIPDQGIHQEVRVTRSSGENIYKATKGRKLTFAIKEISKQKLVFSGRNLDVSRRTILTGFDTSLLASGTTQKFEPNNQSEIIYGKRVSLGHFFKKKEKVVVELDSGNKNKGNVIVSERQILEKISHRYILNCLEIIGTFSFVLGDTLVFLCEGLVWGFKGRFGGFGFVVGNIEFKIMRFSGALICSWSSRCDFCDFEWCEVSLGKQIQKQIKKQVKRVKSWKMRFLIARRPEDKQGVSGFQVQRSGLSDV